MRPARVFRVVSQLCYVFVLRFSRCHDTGDWESTSTSASASAPVSVSASATSTRQSHRKGIASQSEHLHLNPGVHKSQATIVTRTSTVLKSETFSAIRALRHRSKYSKASPQTTQSHDQQNRRLHSVRPGISRTAFLSRGSKALKRNIQPCPPLSHPSTRCSP